MLLLLAGSSVSRRLLQDRAHCAGTDKGTKSFEQKASFVWFCTWNDTTPSTTQKAEIKHVLLKKKKKGTNGPLLTTYVTTDGLYSSE